MLDGVLDARRQPLCQIELLASQMLDFDVCVPAVATKLLHANLGNEVAPCCPVSSTGCVTVFERVHERSAFSLQAPAQLPKGNRSGWQLPCFECRVLVSGKDAWAWAICLVQRQADGAQ